MCTPLICNCENVHKEEGGSLNIRWNLGMGANGCGLCGVK